MIDMEVRLDLNQLRGRLIVSCQAPPSDPLSGPDVMAKMARSVVAAGAAAVRVEGYDDIAAVRAAVSAPVIGLVKETGQPVYITPTLRAAIRLAELNVDMVAVDGTGRLRPDGVELRELAREMHQRDVLVMADVSSREEGLRAEDAGVDVVSTTLAGYTSNRPHSGGPDLDLVADLAEALVRPVLAEGRISTPQQARTALDLGAWAVVVGAAITRPALLTEAFLAEMTTGALA